MKLLPVLVVLELACIGLALLDPSGALTYRTVAISFALFYVAATAYLSKDAS